MFHKRFLTTGEIARICEVSPKTVISWIDRQRLKSFRIGTGPRKVMLQDLYAFLAARRFPVSSAEEVVRLLVDAEEKHKHAVSALD